MSEKRLLLLSAKSGVLVGESRIPQKQTDFFATDARWLRLAAFAAGLLMVAVGAMDLAGRVRLPEVSEGTSRTAFAPAIAALEPGVLSSLMGTRSTTTPTTVTPIVPARLVIPTLNIDARVERVGVKPDGDMANPSSFSTVGWYQLGAKAGEPGNAILAGHVNNGLGLSGVFSRLGSIQIGERVVVRSEQGAELTYAVVEKNQYTTENAPLKDIFSITGPSQLILITCEGDWDPESRSYDRRLVVVAQLIP